MIMQFGFLHGRSHGLGLGHWNWIKFPEDWGPKESRDYEEFQVFWIDETEKDKIYKQWKRMKCLKIIQQCEFIKV